MSARPRLLIIKTSSLGDVVHALPAISDAIAFDANLQIDWVCEEAFADIPALHPAVQRVIPCAVRRWRSTWWTAQGRRELAGFRQSLAMHRYDAVIDLQGLIKSAWITRQAAGVRHGYAWRCAREPLATLAYDRRHEVPWGQHAIARNRQLAAAAIGYTMAGAPRYGVEMPASTDRDGFGLGEPADQAGDGDIVALHATSRDDKLWPEVRWREVLQALTSGGRRVVLPWGSAAERARSLRLAEGIDRARVPDRMAPRELSRMFARAALVIGVDTGLVHLAAASGAPVIALFGASDPVLTGVIGGAAAAVNLGARGRFPDVAEVMTAIADVARPMEFPVAQ